MNRPLLGVNIDHVATLRQARGTDYPSVSEAARVAEAHGADLITIHLREDRRHIQDHDVAVLIEQSRTRLNLEMALTREMLEIALRHRPADVCLVPERPNSRPSSALPESACPCSSIRIRRRSWPLSTAAHR